MDHSIWRLSYCIVFGGARCPASRLHQSIWLQAPFSLGVTGASVRRDSADHELPLRVCTLQMVRRLSLKTLTHPRKLMMGLFGDDTPKKRKCHDSLDWKLTSSRNPAKTFLFGFFSLSNGGVWQSERPRKCHNCQEVSEISEIVRIVGWALATSGLTYKSFVIISINPKDYNETFITKLYKVSLYKVSICLPILTISFELLPIGKVRWP